MRRMCARGTDTAGTGGDGRGREGGARGNRTGQWAAEGLRAGAGRGEATGERADRAALPPPRLAPGLSGRLALIALRFVVKHCVGEIARDARSCRRSVTPSPTPLDTCAVACAGSAHVSGTEGRAPESRVPCGPLTLSHRPSRTVRWGHRPPVHSYQSRLLPPDSLSLQQGGSRLPNRVAALSVRMGTLSHRTQES